MTTMTKKERINAVFNGQKPDVVPVFPFILTQGVYECGWKLPDITTQTELDVDKSIQTVMKTLEVYDYDLAIGSYMDCYFGLASLGGKLHIPTDPGSIVSGASFPVNNKEDWAEVKKKLPIDPRKETRTAGVLESIRAVSDKIGDTTPISPVWWPGPTATMLMLRSPEALCLDVIEDPEFAQEMFDAANQFSIDFLRAQYEAGANSVCLIGEVLGVEMISPQMCEQFVLPAVKEISETIMNEFGQKTVLHIHGNFMKPNTYPLIEKFINECKIGGIYLDEKHSAEWLKENVIDKFNIPTFVPIHGPDLSSWDLEKIEDYTKNALAQSAKDGNVIMTPSCEMPSDVPRDNFKKWVDSIRKYGKYPIS